MITPLALTDEGRKHLERLIADDLLGLGVTPSGLEVSAVQDEGDVFKAFYVYERDCKDVHQSVYFQSSYSGGDFLFYAPVVFAAV